MGIRAIGFLPIKDTSTFLNKFREGLFTLGSFGFDTWICQMDKYTSNNSNNNNNNSPIDAEVKLITFSDTNEVIVGYANGILISDSSINGFLHDVGLLKKMRICRIEGAMAQLGDFKVRYGTVHSQSAVGILFDIEYLPASLLTANFKPLFDSVINMMIESSQAQIELILPPEEPNTEFTFNHLGQLYFKIKDSFVSA
ncbi:hypothetical protein M9Y10_025523 [Tritrichomonas musculus]|uniref:Mediator of RNA polymerase II transcription subunit 20 n=1 Tax=Tritrichomonas musculus TaxID=1915356 RepID=A0ABR2H8X4_9EUKA